MPLEPGTLLGPYEIQSAIGAGGMGEVYKARDTRLDRVVAIKVLPLHWADSPEMKQRFDREAQAIASLNHPHICTLHDVGSAQVPGSGTSTDFLVMEYLEGETLAQRLERGPLALDEALQMAIEIADALDKAHRHGVVHRDLKPGNTFLVRGAGSSDAPIAKLLDFGLAKLKPASGAGYTTPTPPAGSHLTSPGAILGTLQYMSPEQLEGADADPRTDIFAFGVILHEMITGRKAFEGKSRVLLMSAIATAEPEPLSRMQPAAPAALEHVVKACVAKDPSARWQTARDLLAALQLIADGGADSRGPLAALDQKRRLLLPAALAAAVLVVAAMATPAALYLRKTDDGGELRFRMPINITSQPEQVFLTNFSPEDLAMSPDGRAVAFVARPNNEDSWSLFVREIDSVASTRLAGTVGATKPFWSADGHRIGFVSGGKLRKVEASGGPPEDIWQVSDFMGGTWNRDDTIVFGTPRGLFRVSARAGAAPMPLTTLDAAESGHFWPHFLPDGRHYLYLAWSPDAAHRALHAGALDSKDRTLVTPAESKAAYVESGHLVFRRENAAYAQRFDLRTMTVSGDPVRIAEDVTFEGSDGQGNFTVSRNGVLAYLQSGDATIGISTETVETQLLWVSRTGTVFDTVGPPGIYRGAEVSPDGTRVAVHRHSAAGGDVVVLEPRNVVTTITFDVTRHSSMPIWSPPKGDRLVYSAFQKGKWGLYQTLSNGSGTEELLWESDLPMVPLSWSPNGKRILFWVRDPKTAGDLWVYEFDEKKAEPILNTPANESHGQISPDGRWFAYTSNESGRNEIWVRPFPKGAGQWKVSTEGGDWPRWSHDNKELFFHEPVNSSAFTGAILSAPFKATGAVFEREEMAKPVVMTVVLDVPHSGGDYVTYAVHPRGRGFLVFAPVLSDQAAGVGSVDPVNTVVVAMNWAKALPK